MSELEEVKFSLRVMMNKEENKVLFAEVDSSFADVLISFLTLPLGTIVRLLAKHYADEAPRIGSLGTLYQGLVNLDSSNFWTERSKLTLLNPRNSFEPLCRKLKLNIDDSELIKYFVCQRSGCKKHKSRQECVSIYGGVENCSCGSPLDTEVTFKTTDSNDAGVFTEHKASFLISDDLWMSPNLVGSSIKILNDLGITDIDGLEETTVVVGIKEIVNLLKGSLVSRTLLTDVVLDRSKVVSTSVKSDLGASLGQITERATSKRMIVKAIIHKATNRVILAQADNDFVDFLFNLLTLPLAKVGSLLDGNTSLGSVDNLYSSVANLKGGIYLKDFQPMLPTLKYFFKSEIFPLTENDTPALYVCRAFSQTGYVTYLASEEQEDGFVTCRPLLFKDMNEKESYVKGPRMFMVTDDLIVTPSSVMSSFSILNRLKIPLSDVEEHAFEIGTKEALSILKACLTSTSALTDGLKPFMKGQSKKMKQEKDMDGKGSYVKGPSMFMVSDDLVVTPPSSISSLTVLNNLNTPLSDVEELTFEIGRQQALCILKASLTSTSALTDALKPFIERQLKKVKQED
ncbi:hypothetical protein Salat_0123100 [Sesamum alatum]|uniref:DUF674 family protein n=1 Tax=Sesamum alatum TaxID=300844 RepID=A0AAE1YWI5_9LAMI|nr:hypothetical protein Salat_0123100 [Sesamum alatum]